MKFEDIEISEDIACAVKDLGFTDLTEIQELAIPYLAENDVDFIGQAQTGTGKTAAFSIPLLQKIDAANRDIQALVLVPTRELALQVQQDIEKLAKFCKIRSQAIQGGVSYERQIGGIRKNKPQIIVGTPGRVTDLIKRGVLKFDKTKTIILDEADEMLNMGFLEAVEEILSLVSQERKIWMFSATMPGSIRRLIKKNFNDPHMVEVAKKSLSADSIDQRYYLVNEKRHLEALCRILDSEPKLYGIVFCRTRMDTKEVYEELMSRGYEVETLHGDLGQNLRDAAMAKFKRKKVKLMICTDVAARGIDVNNLTHVINYGLPQDAESYVHRIGRTGRAGLKGTAISLIDSRALGKLRRIEHMIKKSIMQAKLPTVKELKASRVETQIMSMGNIVETVREKGEEFMVDETYGAFAGAFDELNKDEVLKTMFTFLLNGELRSYETLGDLNEVPRSGRGPRERGSRDRSSDRSRSERGPRERSRENTREGGGRDRDRKVRSEERRGRDRSDRAPRDRGPKDRSTRDRNDRGSSDKLVSLFIDKGKMDGLQLKKFLSDLSRQTGVKENNIHNVRLKPSFSFIDVAPHLGQQIMEKKGIKINNQTVKIQIAD